MAAARQAAVFLLGPGLIGRALLGQLASQASFLRDKLSVDLGVFAIANSKRMWLSQTPIATAGGAWQAAFQAQGEPTDMARLSAHIRGNPAPCKVLVDCSASDDVPDAYASLMRAGALLAGLFVALNARNTICDLVIDVYMQVRCADALLYLQQRAKRRCCAALRQCLPTSRLQTIEIHISKVYMSNM